MQKIEGCDDRALVLDGNQLQALRSFVADVNKAIDAA